MPLPATEVKFYDAGGECDIDKAYPTFTVPFPRDSEAQLVYLLKESREGVCGGLFTQGLEYARYSLDFTAHGHYAIGDKQID